MLKDLDNKQKIIIVVVLGIMIAVILYNFYNKNQQEYEVFENDEVVGINEMKKDSDYENDLEIKVEEIYVHIDGEVNKPGVFKTAEGARVTDIIDMAGGFKIEADSKEINLATKVKDGEKIYIPNKNEDKEEVVKTVEKEAIKKAKININLATKEEFQTLDGVGDSTADAIITYRKEKGKFKNVEEIKNVAGIGDAKYDKIKNNIDIK